MTNEKEAIEKFVMNAVKWQDLSDFETTKALSKKGVDEKIARDVIRFVPIAFGRAIMKDMGIQFMDHYLLLDGEAAIKGEGKLKEESIFNLAVEMAPAFATKSGYQMICFQSPEFNAVNNALDSGSEPSELVMAPVVMFDEPPSEEGLEKAYKLVEKLAKDGRK